MYYNIKIITDDSELSLDSNDKIITQKEMDLYFAAIFKASDDFRAKIKESALQRGYKKSALRSISELSDLAASSSLKKYEAKNPKESPSSTFSTKYSKPIRETRILNDVDLKDYEIKNTRLASSEIVSIKNLKEKQDIFAKINRKEFFSEKEEIKEPIKFEKVNIDYSSDVNKVDSKDLKTDIRENSVIPPIVQTLTSEVETKPASEIKIETTVEPQAETKAETKAEKAVAADIVINKDGVSGIEKTSEATEVPLLSLINSTPPTMAPTIAPTETQLSTVISSDEAKIENAKTTDELLLETFGASEGAKEEIKEEPVEQAKTPVPTLADYIIRNDELRAELSRDDLNKLRNEYRNELIKEDKAKNGTLSSLSVPKNQGNLIDDEEFELGAFDLKKSELSKPDLKDFETKEQSQTLPQSDLPEIETIISETKEAVQKEETLNTLFGPEISPTVIDEITLDELANKFNNTKDEAVIGIKPDIIDDDDTDFVDVVTPTPVATKQTPISIPALDDTMVSPVAALPVLASTSENPHPSIEEINKILEPPQIPMNEAKPTIAQIEASLTIQDDTVQDKSKEYDILDSSKQKEQIQQETRPFGITLSFAEYIENFNCRNIYDEFLGCAYYLKHYLKQESFSIKTVNAKLYQAKSKIANMSVVTTLVDNEYLVVIPQENSNLYSISKLGEKYFTDKLKL